MREHPIPQDVTAYRFHIVGNMTIKQFAEVGAGCVLAFLVNTTNLPVFLKWPLIGLCVGLGAMVAFVPIEERPLDHWVITFFKVLYKPTQFFWKREPKIPEPFTYKNTQNTATAVAELDLTPVRRERIKEYIGSLDNPLDLNPEELQEQQRIQEIMATFQTVRAVEIESVKVPQKPDLAVRVRDLREQTEEIALPDGSRALSSQASYTDVMDTIPAELTGAALPPTPEMIPSPTTMGVTSLTTPAHSVSSPATPTETVHTLGALPQVNADVTFNRKPQVPEDEDFLITLPTVETTTTPVVPKGSAPTEAPSPVYVPEVGKIKVERHEVPLTSAVNPAAPAPQTSFAYSTTAASPTAVAPAQMALVNPTLPFPSRPTEPNKLVGMVLRPNNTVVDNAIIEIQTTDGRVARAIKTNALGQFFVTTPLENNIYTLVVEKAGVQFPPLQIELNGSVVDPLEIRSLN